MSLVVVLEESTREEEVLPLLLAGSRWVQGRSSVLNVVLAFVPPTAPLEDELLDLVCRHYQALLSEHWEQEVRIVLPTSSPAEAIAVLAARSQEPSIEICCSEELLEEARALLQCETFVTPASPFLPLGEGGLLEQVDERCKEEEGEMGQSVELVAVEAARMLEASPVMAEDALKPMGVRSLVGVTEEEEEKGMLEGGSGREGGVLLGGTFDHLHAGHRLMLTAAAREAGRGVVAIGITTDDLLAKKRYAEQLQCAESRANAVRRFLMPILHPEARLLLFPISDPYGPALYAHLPHAIVASHETAPFVQEKINAVRLEKGLPALRLLCVGLLQAPPSLAGAADCAKLSSTQYRAAAAAAAAEQ